MLDSHVEAVLQAYPAIHAAFRRRSVRDPATGKRLSDHLARILEHLDPAVPISAGDLARQLRVSPATISIQLNRLVRFRLVVRERDPGDARRVLLRLSEAGARMRALRSMLDPERVRAALGQMESQERESAVAGLRLLARAAGTLPGHAAASRPTSKRSRRNSE